MKDESTTSSYSKGSRIAYGLWLGFAIVSSLLIGMGGANCTRSFSWSNAIKTLVTAGIFYSPLWLLFTVAVAWFIWREGRSVENNPRNTRRFIAAFVLICVISLAIGLRWPCAQL